MLDNKHFNDDKTLIIVTFDENGSSGKPNRIATFAAGGLIDALGLAGKNDSTFYTQYSILSTLEASFNAPSLGRWDCSANLLAPLVDKLDYTNADVLSDLTPLFLNSSYAGNASDHRYTPGFTPSPQTNSRCSSGTGVLGQLTQEFHSKPGTYNYTNPFPNDSGANVNQAVIYSPSSLENPDAFDDVLLITPTPGSRQRGSSRTTRGSRTIHRSASSSHGRTISRSSLWYGVCVLKPGPFFPLPLRFSENIKSWLAAHKCALFVFLYINTM